MRNSHGMSSAVAYQPSGTPPQELCGPPVVHRPFPNNKYMHDHQDRTTSARTTSCKRHRITPPTSDSDTEECSRNNQTHKTTTAPPPVNLLRQTTPTAPRRHNTEEITYASHSGDTRPRFPGEDKSTSRPSSAITTPAASHRTDSIRTWYRDHTDNRT
jgi:hypothetical protein